MIQSLISYTMDEINTLEQEVREEMQKPDYVGKNPTEAGLNNVERRLTDGENHSVSYG